MTEVKEISIGELIVSPFNVRYLKPSIDTDFESNIKEHGVLEPITVRQKNNKYEIVMGQRRYNHAKHAELKTVPCIIREMSDTDALFASFAENEFKEDVNKIERAVAIAALGGYDELIQDELPHLIKLSPKRLSLQELAERLGYTHKETISRFLAPLKLKKSLREFAQEHNIALNIIKIIVETTKDENERSRLLTALTEVKEGIVEKLNEKDIAQIKTEVGISFGSFNVDELIQRISLKRQEKTTNAKVKEEKKAKSKEKKNAKARQKRAKEDKKTAEEKVTQAETVEEKKTAEEEVKEAEKREEEAKEDVKKAEESKPPKTKTLEQIRIPYNVFAAFAKYNTKNPASTIDHMITVLLVEFLQKEEFLDKDYTI